MEADERAVVSLTETESFLRSSRHQIQQSYRDAFVMHRNFLQKMKGEFQSSDHRPGAAAVANAEASAAELRMSEEYDRLIEKYGPDVMRVGFKAMTELDWDQIFRDSGLDDGSGAGTESEEDETAIDPAVYRYMSLHGESESEGAVEQTA